MEMNFDFEEEYVETGTIEFLITDTNGRKIGGTGSTNIDMKKIDELMKVCDDRKCSFLTLIELMLEKIRIEEADELLFSLDL